MIFESTFLNGHEHFIAGMDEVGRGPLAGPVVGACCLIKFSTDSEASQVLHALKKSGIQDSKNLTAKKRILILNELGIDPQKLTTNQANTIELNNGAEISYSIYECSNQQIDTMNILEASLQAMSCAFKCIHHQMSDLGEGIVLVDGKIVPRHDFENVTWVPLVKGDQKSVLIGMASILAKVFRDKLMANFALKYPHYGLERNAGYPTKQHREAIHQYGITPIHRKSFKGVREYLDYDLH